ncbi:misexpression suppressor of ras 6 [Aphomia sociella]
MAKISGEGCFQPMKRFKKVPIYVVEEHNDALQFIYSAIGGKKLPVEGTALLHLDAHPDMLIDRKLKGEEARLGRKLLPLLQIENWIVPAVAAGHIGRVVWLRPPWAKQFTDGTRIIRVGDHPRTGLLRVDSTEPYYLSDALYSAELVNERKFTLTVAELKKSNENEMARLIENINISQPYVLDIDLDFFSTGNPFLNLYENIKLYDSLEPIFTFELPEKNDVTTVEKVVELREKQLDELERLFQNLEEHGDLKTYSGEKTDTYDMVSDLVTAVSREAELHNERPDWWAVFAAGCTRDQGGLPHHISTEEEIRSMVKETLPMFLQGLPPPVLITVARSTDDGYCPAHQIDFIQSLVLETLSEIYDTDEPALHYLNANTC